MRLYDVHTLEETQEKINEYFKDYEIEKISIDDALGRVLADTVISNISVPSFRRSTVDGYSVISKETNGASDTMPILLKNIGKVEMGKSADLSIKDDEAIYVPTGGMIPEGADSMVMVEYTEDFSSDTIAVLKQALPFEHIVRVADDIKNNQTILNKGIKISSRHIGVLAATGNFYVNVYKKLRVSIISTGDELITSRKDLCLGEVFDINTHTLKNMSKTFGFDVLNTYVLKDDKELIKNTVKECVLSSDITLISGGSSVGDKDYTADIIDELANEDEGVIVHGLAIKPGKPTIVGVVDKKLVLGLPGHPVSAMIVYDQIIRMYTDIEKPKTLKGKLSQNIHAAPGKETFIMVEVKDKIIPVQGKSGMITLMSNADGFIRIGANDEGLNEGEDVTVYLFD